MHLELWDKDGRVDVEELTENGLHVAIGECKQLLEELEERLTGEIDDEPGE